MTEQAMSTIADTLEEMVTFLFVAYDASINDGFDIETEPLEDRADRMLELCGSTVASLRKSQRPEIAERLAKLLQAFERDRAAIWRMFADDGFIVRVH